MKNFASKMSRGRHDFYYVLGGYVHIRRSGGLDLTSSLETRFGARFSQVHQIRGKIWEVLLPQDAKVGKESQFWGHLGLYLKFKRQNLGYLSPIFWRQNLGLRHEFQRQILGPSSSNLLIWKYPPGYYVPNCSKFLKYHVFFKF